MSYEAFKITVERDILKFFPGNVEDYEVSVMKVNKTNCTLDGLLIENINQKGEFSSAPTLYLQDMYARLKDGESYESILTDTANIFQKAFNDMPNISHLLDKENIYSSLINLEKNRELLDAIPHKIFNDLAMVYKLRITYEDGVASTLITNDLMKSHFKMNLNELQHCAEQNMQKNIYTLKSMNEIMRDMIGEMSNYDLEELLPIPCNDIFYVLMNEEKTEGAVVMTNIAVMNEMGNTFDRDFYILPSSIHEIILVPEDANIQSADLRSMVREVNQEALAPKDFLSDNVYKFDRKLQEVKLVENPNLNKDMDFKNQKPKRNK